LEYWQAAIGLGLDFESPRITQYIGVVALNIILFSGGMDTRLSELKPVIYKGAALATLGVLFTALITGIFIYWLTNNIIQTVTFTILESLLLASIMSSTILLRFSPFCVRAVYR
jgi:cell volume regulation protein A